MPIKLTLEEIKSLQTPYYILGYKTLFIIECTPEYKQNCEYGKIVHYQHYMKCQEPIGLHMTESPTSWAWDSMEIVTTLDEYKILQVSRKMDNIYAHTRFRIKLKNNELEVMLHENYLWDMRPLPQGEFDCIQVRTKEAEDIDAAGIILSGEYGAVVLALRQRYSDPQLGKEGRVYSNGELVHTYDFINPILSTGAWMVGTLNPVVAARIYKEIAERKACMSQQ